MENKYRKIINSFVRLELVANNISIQKDELDKIVEAIRIERQIVHEILKRNENRVYD